MLHNHETKSPWCLPVGSGEIKETPANKAIVKGLLQGKAEDVRVNQICLKYKGSIFVFSVCPDLFSCSTRAELVRWVSHSGSELEEILAVWERTMFTQSSVIL